MCHAATWLLARCNNPALCVGAKERGSHKVVKRIRLIFMLKMSLTSDSVTLQRDSVVNPKF
ncbi:MAG TPA: hypothetical protein VF627_05920, partial [Abditibacterium sp.]